MTKEEIQLQSEKYSVSHEYRIKDKGLLKAVLAERKLSFSHGAEWIQKQLESETAALKAENERLRGLMKSLYVLYNRIEQHWGQFKTENNL